MQIQLPLTNRVIKDARIGEEFLLNGELYTGRDKVCKMFYDLISKKRALPIDVTQQILYHVGPTPAPPGKIIGSAGPTTSSRMDDFTPALLDHGLKATIGKGPRSKSVIESIIKNEALYLVAIGGAGALISKSIKNVELIAYPQWGTEALRKIVVEDFPVIVAIDSKGNNLFETGPLKFKLK